MAAAGAVHSLAEQAKTETWFFVLLRRECRGGAHDGAAGRGSLTGGGKGACDLGEDGRDGGMEGWYRGNHRKAEAVTADD
jgi:hypothetical protein